MTKELLQATLDQLPDTFELEDLIERLIFIEKVEEGLRQSRNGETVSHEDVKKLAQSWRRK